MRQITCQPVNINTSTETDLWTENEPWGGYCGGVPPLPIPNREVKPTCADGTAMQCGRVGSRLLYSRSPEDIMSPGLLFLCLPIFLWLWPLCFLDVLHVRGKINPCRKALQSASSCMLFWRRLECDLTQITWWNQLFLLQDELLRYLHPLSVYCNFNRTSLFLL